MLSWLSDASSYFAPQSILSYAATCKDNFLALKPLISQKYLFIYDTLPFTQYQPEKILLNIPVKIPSTITHLEITGSILLLQPSLKPFPLITFIKVLQDTREPRKLSKKFKFPPNLKHLEVEDVDLELHYPALSELPLVYLKLQQKIDQSSLKLLPSSITTLIFDDFCSFIPSATEISIHFPKLTRLSWSKDASQAPSPLPPRLTQLQLGRTYMDKPLADFPSNLTHLTISHAVMFPFVQLLPASLIFLQIENEFQEDLNNLPCRGLQTLALFTASVGLQSLPPGLLRLQLGAPGNRKNISRIRHGLHNLPPSLLELEVYIYHYSEKVHSLPPTLRKFTMHTFTRAPEIILPPSVQHVSFQFGGEDADLDRCPSLPPSLLTLNIGSVFKPLEIPPTVHTLSYKLRAYIYSFDAFPPNITTLIAHAAGLEKITHLPQTLEHLELHINHFDGSTLFLPNLKYLSIICGSSSACNLLPDNIRHLKLSVSVLFALLRIPDGLTHLEVVYPEGRQELKQSTGAVPLLPATVARITLHNTSQNMIYKKLSKVIVRCYTDG